MLEKNGFGPFGLVEPCVSCWPGEFPVEAHYIELTLPRMLLGVHLAVP
ncbi:hypothetical protein LB516_16395 [Mesorhizobium sp. CO1-1-7]|uniref:Uncharacterized protein n=1 Tax=Mesorhizobium australicum (strain HAMBI 3006 / LMG 24608 / WSM2073) TaxID=754035 RepID=L0KS27_MESAW|nr:MULTISPECIES: hypothetical protein [Mesorhizobium]AGB46784.1 hypothetical protein Mesau_04449 [Mesorhizobium australicum WSM2073]MBZ9684764.1 hypothetical protein [Mesorhizobium sp. CO1-1-2]MBZ9746830.1 hypothetical protein [Mesorhizobium sp. CO1-1-7]MBZ9925049.1 hypothetical protein [Mesorhizobium sp. BR1-1-4]